MAGDKRPMKVAAVKAAGGLDQRVNPFSRQKRGVT
jgi:hypothetical protein